MAEEKVTKVKEEEENIKKIGAEDHLIKTENENVEKFEKVRRNIQAEKNKKIVGFLGALVSGIVSFCTGNVVGIIGSLGSLLAIATDASPDEALKEIEEKLNIARRNIQSSKEKKQEFQNQNDVISVEISRLNKEIRNKLELKILCKEETKKINERFENCEKNIKDSAKKIEEKGIKLTEKHNNLAIASDIYDAIKQKRETAYSSINSINSTISSIGKDIVGIASQITRFVPPNINELVSRKTKIDAEINGLNQRLTTVNSEVNKVQTRTIPSKLKS